MKGYRISSGSSGGIGILGVLQIIFIVLKLCGVIDWSWWLVFIPTFAEILLYASIYAYFTIKYRYNFGKECRKRNGEGKNNGSLED